MQYHAELESLASSLSLRHLTAKTLITALSAPADIPVLFLLSIPSSLKNALLRSARVLLYTPANEHFGIVPLEAMLSRTPVLAADSGGPVETVVDGETGWLRSPEDVSAWAEVVRKVLSMGDNEVEAMGEKGAARVKELFGREQMSLRLEEIVDDIITKKQPASPTGAISIIGACLVCSFALVVAVVLTVLSK